MAASVDRNALGCAKPAIFCWALLLTIVGVAAMAIFFLALLPPRQSKELLAISGGVALSCLIPGLSLWANLCCNPCEGVRFLPELKRDETPGLSGGETMRLLADA